MKVLPKDFRFVALGIRNTKCTNGGGHMIGSGMDVPSCMYIV